MLHAMSPRPTPTIALLLIALLLISPLQSVLAGWGTADDIKHCDHGAAQQQHEGHGMHVPHGDCCATADAGSPADGPAHDCDGGCDHCASCGTAALTSSSDAPSAVLDLPPWALTASGQPLHQASTLLRPPQSPL